ncbi:MAG: type II secretion system protein GspL [Gammaproteobacteria bacterium]|nr:type II secretion system protein GspL [Gammaproteobacteria bacterium]
MNIIYYNALTIFDELSSDKRYLIAIDANLVSTHQVELPKISPAKAKKAIPFLLEDVLLSDIEELDFFVKKTIGTPNFYDVIVVEKQVMSGLQRKIEQAQLEVERCVIDFMLLPNEQGKMHYIEDEQGVLFRLGEFLGGRMNKVLFDKLPTDDYQLISATIAIKHTQQVNLLDIDWLRNWEKLLHQWRFSIVIILSLMVLMPVQLIVDNYYLNQQIQTQQNSNKNTFKKLFPEVRRIVDLPVQIKQKLKQANKYKSRSGDDLLSKLTEVKSKATIKRLKFNQKTLTLTP